MNILITGIGGPTPRSIGLRIRKLYPDAKIIGVDIEPKAIGFYLKGLLDKSYVVPKASETKYWPTIKDILSKERVDLAFVQSEKEVLEWGAYYNKHGEMPCKVLIPPYEYTRNLIDKNSMAGLLKGSGFIPKTIRFTQDDQQLDKVKEEVGYPCWIRATTGSGGFGSLKLKNEKDLKAWLLVHEDIQEFTVSEFLPGRHMANQMLYFNGECIKNAGLHCAEYVMANIAPSKVTGNTSFGRLINEDTLLNCCENVMDYIANQLKQPPHGVFSFDFKEDQNGELKVTEINIRHMAYTGIMAEVGFDLVNDTIKLLNNHPNEIEKGRYYYDNDYVFLRDVDIHPIIMKESELKK